MNKCVSCKAFVDMARVHGSSRGECRMHAPRAGDTMGKTFKAAWPIVEQDDGCLEWTSKYPRKKKDE